MGCCLSTSSSSSPYPVEGTASSSRAINDSQRHSAVALPRPSTNHTTSSQQPTTRLHVPLAEHVSKPLRRHAWTSKTRTWTRAQLEEEREAFYDTRVDGRQEIWQTIRTAIEVMNEGGDDNIATAQSILDAAGITLPRGNLAGDGAYDQFGHMYNLPEWVVADPDNIVIAEERSENKDVEVDGEETEQDNEEISRRREEKGKTPEKDLIKVRARLSDRAGPDIVVKIGKEASVRSFTKKIFEEAGLTAPQRIRIVYMGRILSEKESLISQGWNAEHIVNAFVF